MTHEEDEDVQHDISKLQDKVQQIQLPQKVTKAKTDVIEENRKETWNI